MPVTSLSDAPSLWIKKKFRTEWAMRAPRPEHQPGQPA
jgi:hypothetical protein